MHGIVTLGCDVGVCSLSVSTLHQLNQVAGDIRWDSGREVIPSQYEWVEMHSLNTLGFACQTYVIASVS